MNFGAWAKVVWQRPCLLHKLAVRLHCAFDKFKISAVMLPCGEHAFVRSLQKFVWKITKTSVHNMRMHVHERLWLSFLD